MTELELNISSKDQFIDKLNQSIDNVKPGIFHFSKQKYSGQQNADRFNLVENRVKYNYPIFYKIHGQIHDEKVKINIEFLNSVYVTIGIYLVLGICLFFIPYKHEIGFVWLLYFVALYSIGLWIYGFFTRKSIIIRDFEKMAER